MRTDFKDALDGKHFKTWEDAVIYARQTREDLITEAIIVADSFNEADNLEEKRDLTEHFNFTCEERGENEEK